VIHVGKWLGFWPMCGTEGELRVRDCLGSFNTITLRHCHRFVADCEEFHTVEIL
jgi:hypothetical protein